MKWWVMKVNMVAVLFLNMAAVTSCKTNKVVLVAHLLLLTNVHANPVIATKLPSACASRSSRWHVVHGLHLRLILQSETCCFSVTFCLFYFVYFMICCLELLQHKIKIPTEMKQNLMILHSYILVKVCQIQIQ